MNPAVGVYRAPQRFDRLDALRGLAVVWMALFHFAFDLNHFGWWWPRQNFYGDPFWTTQRTVIVSLFLACAGMGQAVAMQGGASGLGAFDRRFWRRWAQVAGSALLVSAGSALMFPRSWISFGVLHGIAVMLLACRLTAGLGAWLWPIGAACLALPRVIQHAWFDAPWSNWIGLVTHKPITEDYVPVLPWLGVMLWGLALGRWLLARHPQVLAGAWPRCLSPLATLGRWSLSFYMLHQPILIGALLAWQAVIPGGR